MIMIKSLVIVMKQMPLVMMKSGKEEADLARCAPGIPDWGTSSQLGGTSGRMSRPEHVGKGITIERKESSCSTIDSGHEKLVAAFFYLFSFVIIVLLLMAF